MMKPFPCLPLLLLFSLFLISHVCAAADQVERSVYIVHMDKSQMPMAFSTHHHWYSSLLTSAVPSIHHTASSSDTLHQNLIYVYDNAFHGFSALLSQEEAESLNTFPGFISSYRDTIRAQPETTRSVDFLGLSSASGLWPASQLGKDVIIGVIDSGIWPESPSFRDTGMGNIPAKWKGICQEGEQFNSSLCNKKLIGARYFNQGIRAADPNITIPMNSARDTDGHGTHVASTAAGSFVNGVSYFGYANGTARGVAPAARIAAYKVLWPVGDGGGADILAGIDQAVADGVDILSISLTTGPDNINLYENPLSIASFGAREKGVVVVFSAGNRGPSLRTIREKGMPWGIVVAAGTVDRWFTGRITLGNGKSITGWSLYPGRASIRNLPIVYSETLAACNSSLPDFARKGILVCNASTEFSLYALDNVLRYLPGSGARAGIIIGEIIAEDRSFYRTSSYPYPMTVVNRVEGQELINYALSTTKPRATISFHETINGPGGPWPAPALASFSSKGPARSLPDILKPDIMAPGMLILAAYPPNTFEVTADNKTLTTNYPLLWGTSMACPHISGVAALLKAAYPDWSPSAIQSAMMTTANPLNNVNKPIKEIDNMLASPLGIGSGHVDPNRALNPGLVYDSTPQDFVNFVCALNYTVNQTRTLIRSNYNCSAPSADLNYPSLVATFHPPDQGRTLTKRYQRIVTNVGNGAATYGVRVEAPTNATVTVTPQRLVFGKKYEKQSYSVRVRFVADVDFQHRAGAIIWSDQTGKYSVRIPVMISAGPDFFE